MHKRTLSMPMITKKHTFTEQLHSPIKLSKKVSLVDRLQVMIQPMHQAQEELLQEYQQVQIEITPLQELKQLIVSLLKVKEQLLKYEKGLLLRRVDKNINRMRQPQPILHIWNKLDKIPDKSLLALLNKFPLLLKDANYLLNLSKNILSNFKNSRWQILQFDISRTRHQIDNAVDKVRFKMRELNPEIKYKIINSVNSIKCDTSANKPIYSNWKSKAMEKLLSSNIKCDLLKDQLYSSIL